MMASAFLRRRGVIPVLAVAGLMALTACSTMKNTNRAGSIFPGKLKSRVSNGELRYLVYLPVGYETKSETRWPLMLFLHGAGERGTNLEAVAVHGPLKRVKQGEQLPFIVVAPQCPEGKVWANEPLLALLDRVTNQFAVDTNRIYLTGLSMGGYGTWGLGLAQPERFAAIAPICGGSSLMDVLLGARERPAIKRLPVWAFHGAKDGVVPLTESQRMVEALQSVGARNVRFTVYPEATHDSWTETYDNPEFYDWLLRHQRK